MKTQISNILNMVSNSEVKDVMMAVKESMDKSQGKSQNVNFSSAELWNIQRHRRSIGLRRGFAY